MQSIMHNLYINKQNLSKLLKPVGNQLTQTNTDLCYVHFPVFGQVTNGVEEDGEAGLQILGWGRLSHFGGCRRCMQMLT